MKVNLSLSFVYPRAFSFAKATNLPLAEYARRQLMNEKLTAKYEIVADLPELKKLIAEFGKIGSNLLNENGEMIAREEYLIDGINCSPFT